MSYCRWSTDDFQCDLYIYESCHGGYSINIASRRRMYHEPLPPPINFVDDLQGWFSRQQSVMRMPYDMVDIDLEHTGKSFTLDTPAEVITFLGELRALGYIFPDDVIESLQEEIV